jgi:hypothetical protein
MGRVSQEIKSEGQSSDDQAAQNGLSAAAAAAAVSAIQKVHELSMALAPLPSPSTPPPDHLLLTMSMACATRTPTSTESSERHWRPDHPLCRHGETPFILDLPSFDVQAQRLPHVLSAN